jgi:hypothetical protein
MVRIPQPSIASPQVNQSEHCHAASFGIAPSTNRKNRVLRVLATNVERRRLIVCVLQRQDLNLRRLLLLCSS